MNNVKKIAEKIKTAFQLRDEIRPHLLKMFNFQLLSRLFLPLKITTFKQLSKIRVSNGPI